MILQSIWFFLWGLLWAVFFMTGGFDLGIGALFPVIGKNDMDRRKMINALGPLWDGNEVWLITAGGVTFAAFPMVYSVMFSALYTPLMLILFALIIRGVSFEFRHLSEHPAWKAVWDTAIMVGSAAPAILFGVAFANIFKGIPIDADGLYQGNLMTLLNPYGIAGGVLFLLLFVMHGGLWLCIRTDGDIQARSIGFVKKLWPALVVMAVIFLVFSYFATPLYNNYFKYPALFAIIVLAVAGLLGIRFFVAKEAWFKAWFSSCLAIVSATFFGVAGLFPNLFPSSLDPKFSLTAFNASSSPLTLQIMLGVTLVFIPVVICYQAWAYRIFSHKVDESDLTY